MSFWLNALLFALAAYTAVLLLLWAAQDSLVFHPRPTPPAAAKQYADWAVAYEVGDGVTLRGWLTPDNPQASGDFHCRLLIFFGGNSEEVSHNLDDPRPFPHLYLNMRGFGDSDGKPSEQAWRQDALKIFDETLRRSGLAPEQICVMGRSLGSYLAIHIAAHRPVGRVVIMMPPDSVLNIARLRYPIFPVRQLLRHPFDSTALAPQVKAPTLALLAASDWIVPHTRSRNLFRFWQAPLSVVTMPGTTHNQAEGSDYWPLIDDFLTTPAADAAG